MFQIVIVSAHAPSVGGGKFRRPINIRIFNPEIQKTEYAKQGKGHSVKKAWEWRNVDSRFQGPRSAYGKAMAEAKEMLAMLNNGEGAPE